MFKRQLAVLRGLLMILVVLALSACGGAGGGGAEQHQEGSKPRPLPENLQALRPGEYRSEEFKPSLSFTIGEGWTNDLEISDALSMTRGEEAGLAFLNVQQVYKPGTTLEVVDAPKDLVGWFQQHPYLQTDKPEPVMVGGFKGEQFDVVVEDLPEDYYGACGSDCVDLFKSSDGSWWAFVEEWKERVIILEDVHGETVTIDFGSPATEFDEGWPKAEKVIDSVEWKGA